MTARALADRWLRPDLARFVAAAALVMAGASAVVMFVTEGAGGTAFGPHLGADYAHFYAAGVLQNEQGVDRLYDLDLQDRILHRVVPGLPSDEHNPYVHPPFVAFLFRPLALLPYRWSCALWLALTGALYAASIAWILRSCGSLAREDRVTAWLLALSFEPFAFECWLGGQMSALGCLAVAVGLACARGGRPGVSGLALSLLCFKPSLLVLLLPLLVIGRRWRILAGFTAGAVALAAVSVACAGTARCLEFGRLMVGFSRLGGGGGLPTAKYVDLTAFLRLLGLGPGLVRPLSLALALPPLAALGAVWRRADRLDLAWSATLCWTPVLNVYGPVYDVALVVPGLLLGADAIRRRDPAGWPDGFRFLLATLYATAWLSPPLAISLGLQPLTLGLAALGTYLIRAALREVTDAGNSGGASLWQGRPLPAEQVAGSVENFTTKTQR